MGATNIDWSSPKPAPGGPDPGAKPSFVAYEIDGGLDLVTSLTHVRPGAMVGCQNYEVARQRGARRIEGYELYDGGASPSYATTILWTVTGPWTAVVGAYLLGASVQCICVSPSTPAQFVLPARVVFSANTYSGSPQLNFQIQLLQPLRPGYSIVAVSDSSAGAVVNTPTISVTLVAASTNSADLAARALYFASINPTIQAVPGTGNVNGLFYLKDTLYATRDMTPVSLSSIVAPVPNPQDVIYQGGSFATATWTGVFCKLDGNGTFNVYNTTGTLTTGALFNHTQGNISAGAALATATNAATAAALYKAVGTRGNTTATASWQFCDLGWTIPYTNAGVSSGLDFLDMNLTLQNNTITSSLQSTAWKTATTVTVNGWALGGTASSFVDGLSAGTGAGDTKYDWYTGNAKGPIANTGVINATAFGFTASDIPATSTLTGFEVQINCGAVKFGSAPLAANLRVGDGYLKLVGTNDNVNHNFALPGSPWSFVTSPTATTYTNRDYGGSQALLGYSSSNQSNILQSTFGLQLQLAYTNGGSGLFSQTGSQYIDAHINNVQMRVWFLPQTNQVYFWDGFTAVRAIVVQHYQTTGTLAAHTAAGTLYFQFVQANGSVGGQPSRPINGGEKIYQYPGNGGTPNVAVDPQIATTGAAAAMNVMDWSSILAAPPLQDGTFAAPSKYESITKNFYATTGYDAIYGVSGAGPAFYYDGTNFSRILTGLAGVLESPRHITEHQGHLVLGYYSGLVEWSNTDNVLRFDPTLGNQDAGDQGFGEQIVGVRSLQGDALAVWTKTQLKMIQGQLDTPSGVYISTISPTSGGIEWSIQPTKDWMYADFRGITSISATQKYGDFEIGHLSSLVAPFLIPRLQLSSQFEAANIGPINSTLVRNKNQYRQFFADGWALTVTMLVDGEPPQFTTQRYFHADGVTPLTWDVVEAFTQSTGRDHIFGATADGTGNVYELERGLSFNGGAIPAYVQIAGNDLQSPYNRKTFFDVGVHGVAQDYAAFNMSRSGDYTVPTSTPAIPQTFGSLTAAPTNQVLTFVSFNVMQIEGRSLNIRFDSNLNNQFPHALQTIVVSAKPSDDKRT